MTPEQKEAKRLVELFLITYDRDVLFFEARQCALKCVDEIISANPTEFCEEIIDGVGYTKTIEDNTFFWEEVKQEITKL